jgi:hypothetical protein
MRCLPWNTDDLRRYSRALSRSNPTLLWWHAGMKTWETMLVAPQVIAERTARMVAAGPLPAAADRRELVTMGTEKVIAFSEAWIGAAREIVSLQQEMLNTASRQWWSLMTAFNPLLRGRAARVAQNPASMMTQMLSSGNRVASALPRVAHGAVKPVHAKATSNAKRLRRRS